MVILEHGQEQGRTLLLTHPEAFCYYAEKFLNLPKEETNKE